MSLMLGNRYFLARDFGRAVPLYEEVVRRDPECDRVLKRLLVAYVQVGRLDDALELFLEILQRNPRCIIDTDLVEEDCPCPHLCGALKERLPRSGDPYQELLGLGILELYCDLDRSLDYLRQASALRPKETGIQAAIDLLRQEEPAHRPPEPGR